MPLFEKCIFPAINELVKEGGKFEGYLPIIQGDNAGPHEDAKFKNYVNKECEEKGWLWEPQGPQMPHMNVLDLAVFPAMSRRHSHLCRAKNGMKVLKEDDIWDCAQTVWEELPSSKIANAFVHAKRIAEKIVASKGDNGFLAGIKGKLSAGVRNDFMETDFGNKRRDGIKMEFERENKNDCDNASSSSLNNASSSLNESILNLNTAFEEDV
mmetsp:Transcript_26210/g.32313  ORF Transcript_26210/g.32313 Transcript_26210/m.32313 type:complete len:211 (+) Transcript_26210:515-1147(+)